MTVGQAGALFSIPTNYTQALGDFTAFARFYYPTSPAVAYQRVMDKTFATGFWLGQDNGNASFGGGIKQIIAPYGLFAAAAPDVWHTIARRRIGTAGALWMDGSKTTDTVDGSALDTSALIIGNTLSTNDLQGWLAQVCIWDVGLSDDEIGIPIAGFSPKKARPQSIKVYAPLFVNRNIIWGNSVTSGTVWGVDNSKCPRMFNGY